MTLELTTEKGKEKTDAAFYKDVQSASHANLERCYQCNACSSGCPAAYQMDYPPHQMLRMVQLGLKDRVLNSNTFWICLSCETCAARCPNLCDPARVIDNLREMSLAGASSAAPRAIRAFHEAFLNQIKSGGRLFEVGLIANYKFTGGPMLADVMTAPGMFMRGKLKLTPRRIKGIKDVRRIFAACEAADKEQL
jgi:heterodisulfide reductase subunit C2